MSFTKSETTVDRLQALSQRLVALSIDALEDDIADVLAYLARLLEVERCYLSFIEDLGARSQGIIQWTQLDVPPRDAQPPHLAWTLSQLRRGIQIAVSEPSVDLPPEAQAERELCEALGVVSYINVPLLRKGELMGWLGFDHVRSPRAWRKDELKLTEMAGALLIQAVSHKQNDRELMHEKELSQRLASMGTLTAGLAHEINNPMSFIHSNLGLAQELLHDNPTLAMEHINELRVLLAEAQQGVSQVRQIVEDLRTFTRPPTDEKEVVDILSVLDATARMTQSQVKHRATIDPDYQGVPPVYGSASKFGQVFLNLIMNAYQALPEGRAASHFIRLRAFAQGIDRVVIEVEDNGRGIPEHLLSQVFAPYFTTRNDEGGTGIGLALCRSIVRSLGGHIDLTSEVGVGTCVRLTLKSAPNTVRHRPSSSSITALKISARRVLLIDDHEIIQRSFQRVLKMHTIESATSGSAAIELLCKDQDFDIILCDLHMPDGTGQDVYHFLREHHPDLCERLVFLTGGASSEDMRKFLDAVPNRTLHKPCDNYDLRALVLEMPLLRIRG